MGAIASLLYLHGVGEGDLEGNWLVSLNSSLRRVGYADCVSVNVSAPHYADILKGTDLDLPLPKVVTGSLRGEDARTSRRDYERRRAAMEEMLGDDDRGDGWPAAGPIALQIAKLDRFVQVANYRDNQKVRAAVLHHVLQQLPTTERLVIIGHSLGSVVAADLLCRLPISTTAVTMITIGSPLPHSQVHPDGMTKLLAQPPRHVQHWVNFWSRADGVPAGRGVAKLIPWVLDQRLEAKFGLDFVGQHAAASYLQDHRVATAVGFGLFGSQSRAVVRATKQVGSALGPAELSVLLGLRFIHLVQRELDGERRDRYADAVRNTQAAVHRRFVEHYSSAGMPLPPEIAQLKVELVDPSSQPPEPRTPRGLSMEDSVSHLVSIMSMNLLTPYEIEVPDDAKRKALSVLTTEMGLGSAYGLRVFDAGEEAWKVLKGSLNWRRWAAVGFGALVLIGATGGLALAAAPGVVGAAAVTSALAAFGPGGMVGGLLTAGSLVTAGSSSIALGLVSASASAAAVESAVATKLTAAIIREWQGLPADPGLTHSLVDMEADLCQRLDHLKQVSDANAGSLKELERKLEAVSRALEFLNQEISGPDVEVVGLPESHGA